MLDKAIALIGLTILSFLVSLANYWYVFGIWPKSWVLFVVLSSVQLGLVSLMRIIGSDTK